MGIRNGADKAEVLKKEIFTNFPEAVTSVFVNKKVLHLIEWTEQQTWMKSKKVSQVINVITRALEVRALRPASGDKRNATFILNATGTNKLLCMKEIEIRWSKCEIFEREKRPRAINVGITET